MMPTIQDTVHALESAVAQAHSETIRETSNFLFSWFYFSYSSFIIYWF
jgi:hypothetical protein